MSSAPTIEALLLRWEELRAAGQEVTAEELCGDHAELLSEVRRRLEVLRAVYGVLDTAIPPTHPGEGPPGEPAAPDAYAFLAPPQQPGELGRLGPYRILKVLGEGGMGLVFQAEDPQLKRLVALKVMKPALAASATARQRFLREAQAMAALEHDHIVTIHHVGEERGVPFLTMQLLRGETLDERLKEEGETPAESDGRQLGESLASPLADVLRLGREIAEGLAAAHAQGLIHRDIKPANIWLEAGSGRVKILDFGLARAVEDDARLTQPGVITGTPTYMAPEQAAGETVDHRCDLFSLGCVLYRMETGQLPFPGATAVAVLRALAVEQPKSPRELNPAVPPALADLTLRLLAKDPKNRPQTARAVAEALVTLERAETKKAKAQPSRRRWLPTAAALGLVLALGGMVLGLGPAAVYRFATNQGQLVIQTDDPDVEVTIKRGGEQIQIVDTRTGNAVTLTAGTYQLELSKGKDGWKLETNQFTLKRGGQQIVKVWLEPGRAPSRVPEPASVAAEPFVLLARAGQAEREVATLTEAVAQARDGDTIEIRSPGPFVTPALNLGKRALVLRAGAGFEPVLQIDAKSLEADAPLLSTDGPLVLEGLHFRHVEDAARKEGAYHFIVSQGAPLSVTHCRFFFKSSRNANALCPWKSPRVEVRHCEFAGAANNAINWGNLASFGQLEIADCLCWGANYFVYYAHSPPDVPREIALRIHRNTFVGTTAVLHFYRQLPEPPANPDLRPFRIDARENVLDADGVFALVLQSGQFQPEVDQPLLPRCLAWNESKNLYTSGLLYLCRHADKYVEVIKRLDDWQGYWGLKDTGSLHGRLRYQGGNVRAMKASAPEKLAAADFRLRPDSDGQGAGPNGRDLGADVDKVGPGKAYEAWKKTPAYPKWLAATGQVRDSEPFVVLAPGGKREYKFANLADAIVFAHSGDTIEIRGNGPFATDPIKVENKALTIRAGTGWEPVLQLAATAPKSSQWMLLTDGPLVLEGLQFQHLEGEPGKDDSSYFILVYSQRAPLHVSQCRFFIRSTRLVYALSGLYSPFVQVHRCHFAGRFHVAIHWAPTAVAKLEVEDCLSHGADYFILYNQPPADKPWDITLRIRRNTFLGRRAVTHYYRQLPEPPAVPDANPIQIDARENVLDSDQVFALVRTEKDKFQPEADQALLPRCLAWKEQTNLYGGALLGLTHHDRLGAANPIKALDEWRRYWGLNETGSLQGGPRYQGGDLRAKMAAAPEQLTPADFRLHADSLGYRAGSDGGDLGAEVELVGPGPAYERWRKTPAYQQWRQVTGQTR